jgi:DNA-binding NarL/FixJ family response regulator
VRQAFSQSIYLAGSADIGETVNATAAAKSSGTGLSVLTRRELETHALVAEGHSNSATAKRLWVTEQTVKFHLSNIYRKLDREGGVANPPRPAGWAHKHGLTSPPSVAET